MQVATADVCGSKCCNLTPPSGELFVLKREKKCNEMSLFFFK